MRIDVLTIFPDFFRGPFDASLLGRAREAGRVELRVLDLRDWTTDARRTVDGAPYGGGAGMLMTPEPFFDAVEDLYGTVDERPWTLLMTPRGRRFTQGMASELGTEDHLLLLCGRYEGIDERVHLHLAHDEVSIGDVVLAGGEVAAAVVVEAVTRLLPGVMGNDQSGVEESFGEPGQGPTLLEHPQYTRPASFRGWEVPGVLRSGDHGRVKEWRKAQSRSRTRLVRPDLTERVAPTDEYESE